MEDKIIQLNKTIEDLKKENKDLDEKLGHITLYACQLRKELQEERRTVKRRL